MKNFINYKPSTCSTFWLLIVSFQSGCTENNLEPHFNDRNLELCRTAACEATGNNSCSYKEFSSCSDVLCVDACAESYFIDSDIFCEYDLACENSAFENSQVVCNETKACRGATFINSAVECHLSVDDYSEFSCKGANWFQCNCCLNDLENGSCPPEIPPCSGDSFCASTFLGQTCKDWGNPICANSTVESIPPIHPADECSAGEDIVECGLRQDCQEMDGFASCSVNCIGDQGCNSTDFNQSIVACQVPYSCDGSIFVNSKVACTAEESCGYIRGVDQSNVICQGPLSCDSSLFMNSNVTCIDAESCLGTTHVRGSAYCGASSACDYATFHDIAVDCMIDGACGGANWISCSCCKNSEGCPMDVEACYDYDTGSPDHFCNTTFLGQTCKDWGNPICADSAVSSLPPLHPASTCSENVDVLECVGNCWSSTDTAIDSCTVFCLQDCDSFTFDNSTVYCSHLCDGSSFRGSEVECSNDGCWITDFKSSAVNCSNDYDTCMDATLDECSCCLNTDNCPDGIDLCFDETGSADTFCSQIYNDQKCMNTPNPICKNFVPTLAPTPAQQSLTTSMDAPVNIEAPSPTNITKVSFTKNPMNGVLSIQSNNTVTYTPNKGFVGFDEFIVEFCYKDSHCETMDVEVEVKSIESAPKPTVPTIPGEKEKSGTSKGLYALSVLVLIPSIIVSVAIL